MPNIEVPDFFTPNPKKEQHLDNLEIFFKKYGNYLMCFIVIVPLFFASIVKVDAGERAVIFNIFGAVEKRVLGEGIHLVIPLIQRASIYDVK